MMAIKGIYAPYGVRRLNHGIGFNTAAIELLLPTYGERLGLKGKVATHFALNPHPTLIPAIESGWVQQIHSFGGEVGMEDYIRARPDIYFTGPDGSLRSNRAFCQTAGETIFGSAEVAVFFFIVKWGGSQAGRRRARPLLNTTNQWRRFGQARHRIFWKKDPAARDLRDAPIRRLFDRPTGRQKTPATALTVAGRVADRAKGEEGARGGK